MNILRNPDETRRRWR